MNFSDFLVTQRGVVESNKQLQQHKEDLQAKQEGYDSAVEKFNETYPSTTKGLLAGMGIGGLAGAGLGAAIGRRGYATVPGAVIGGMTGGLVGGGIGEAIHDSKLDKRYPGRYEDKEQIDQLYDESLEAENLYNDRRRVHNLALEQAARMAKDNPIHYQQALSELGNEYPTQEIDQKIYDLARADAVEQAEAQHVDKGIQKETFEELKLKNELLRAQLAEKQQEKQASDEGREEELEANMDDFFRNVDKAEDNYKSSVVKSGLGGLGVGAGLGALGTGAYTVMDNIQRNPNFPKGQIAKESLRLSAPGIAVTALGAGALGAIGGSTIGEMVADRRRNKQVQEYIRAHNDKVDEINERYGWKEASELVEAFEKLAANPFSNFVGNLTGSRVKKHIDTSDVLSKARAKDDEELFKIMEGLHSDERKLQDKLDEIDILSYQMVDEMGRRSGKPIDHYSYEGQQIVREARKRNGYDDIKDQLRNMEQKHKDMLGEHENTLNKKHNSAHNDFMKTKDNLIMQRDLTRVGTGAAGVGLAGLGAKKLYDKNQEKTAKFNFFKKNKNLPAIIGEEVAEEAPNQLKRNLALGGASLGLGAGLTYPIINATTKAEKANLALTEEDLERLAHEWRNDLEKVARFKDVAKDYLSTISGKKTLDKHMKVNEAEMNAYLAKLETGRDFIDDSTLRAQKELSDAKREQYIAQGALGAGALGGIGAVAAGSREEEGATNLGTKEQNERLLNQYQREMAQASINLNNNGSPLYTLGGGLAGAALGGFAGSKLKGKHALAPYLGTVGGSLVGGVGTESYLNHKYPKRQQYNEDFDKANEGVLNAQRRLAYLK